MMPMNHIGIHVVNEAYSNLQGWAEGSLMLADEVLEMYFDCPRPWDFQAPDYVQFVRQTQGATCVEEEDSGSGGGGDTGSGAGDGTVDLCFTKDALVTMGDGSMVPINQIKQGDVVATGFDGKTGRVTEALIHEVTIDGDVDVVSVATPHGDLVGTPSHPIFVGGQWIEMQEALEAGMFEELLGLEASLAQKKVDAFYNLEIDGEIPGKSSHSYVVNGIVASGLGDNSVLNVMFPRQNEWKEKA
mmetsp:Transcript_27956/g.39501  ORF Transcript_27956/g.39501 Transcript_27956/m.39501 type:complete len:244 (+) Transcript_27956:2236-2967(+)